MNVEFSLAGGIGMWMLVFIICGVASGFVLFRGKRRLPSRRSQPYGVKLSVIIPARNEEGNLPHLLASLQAQTVLPDEIIVVNDDSSDRTGETAASFGVRVIDNPPPPPGWTGKNWACWNGFRASRGDVLAFVDADIRLAPDALASLLAAWEHRRGAISVVPYHIAERFYEKLSLITNLLGMFAFTSPFEARNPKQGLYGPFILVARADYEKIGGHRAIRSEVTDDLSLGAAFKKAGLSITNYLGCGLVRFRMYPNGLRSQFEGFAKSAALSTATLHPMTVALIALWLAGLVLAESALLFAGTKAALPLFAGYGLYTAQIFYLAGHAGDFKRLVPLVHGLSMLFFLPMLAYSLYQVLMKRRVVWKGRQIRVGRIGR